MKKFGDVVQIIQSVVTIGALIIGGYWTYHLFIQQRQAYPRLKIEHSVTHLPLPDHRLLLLLDITHTNVGEVKVSLPSADVRVYELAAPASGDDQAPGESRDGPSDLWEVIDGQQQTWKPDELVVEPGESDTLHYEFVLSPDVGPLLLYSYFENPTANRRHIGWTHTSVYNPGQSDSSTHNAKPAPQQSQSSSPRP